MKKNILLTGAVMLMLAACSNEEILTNEEEPVNNAEPTLTIIATQGDAESRLTFVDEKNLVWTENDAIYVTEAESPTHFIELTLSSGANTNTGTFTTSATLPDTWTTGETNLVAYYKAHDDIYYSDGEGYAYFTITSYGFALIQTADNAMSHLVEQNYMKSGEFTCNATSDGDGCTVSGLKFKHLSAILKFTLTGLSGKNVNRLVLNADDDVFVASSMLYFYDGSEPSSYNDFQSQVSLNFNDSGNNYYITMPETFTAYMAVGATEATNGKSLTLYAFTNEGEIYSASVSGGTLEDGKIYSISKEMSPKTFFSQGIGSEEAPYEISSEAELRNFAEWANIKDTYGTYFKQTGNITLTSTENWTPIYDFNGTFDGGGHTISGLKYEGSGNYVGLFIYLHGVVKDVNLADVNLQATGDDANVGGITGDNLGTITHCSVSGTIQGGISSSAGGIAGINQSESQIIACHNAATVSGNTAGGIVGSNSGVITGCYNTGACTSDYVAGGIAGWGETSGNITACYSTGSITSTGDCYIGGISGFNREATLSACYWSTSESGSSLEGVGYGSSDGVEQVTDGDWSTATEVMNTALEGTGWKYELNTDTDTKDKEPLKLAVSTSNSGTE